MMAIYKYILILVLLLIIVAGKGYPQTDQTIEKSVITESIDGKDFYLHFVKKGETLFAIARAYNVTVDDIFRVNPGSRDGVAPGKILKILHKTEPAQDILKNPLISRRLFFYYIVKKQETLYGISQKNGVTIDAIKAINPDLGEYPRTGETLKIPYLKDEAITREANRGESSIIHTVQKGETLYGIAKTYDVTIGEIKNANPGLTDALDTGASIVIPNQESITETEEQPDKKSDSPGIIEHEVVLGETLYSIASKYAVSIDSLKKYNPGLISYISPGQVLIIPPVYSHIEYIVHKPANRQSLAGISEMYEVELEELEKLNPEIKRKAKRGRTVKIPVEPREETEVRNHTEEEEMEAEPVKDLEHCFEGNFHKSNTYNIALMLPLFLEEIDSVDFDKEKDFDELVNLVSFRFLNFYAGFKMAVDSMINKGMKLNLFVYDVDNDIKKAEKVLYASELSSMDMIVGPFYLNSFRKVADFANTYQIPIINPLSQREEIINNNPYVFKVQPSKEKQIDQLLVYLLEEYPTNNIVILRNNKYKYQTEVSYIRNYLNSKRTSFTYISNQVIHDVIEAKETRENLFTENKLLEPDSISNNLDDSTYFSNLVKEVIYSDDSITGLKMNLSEVRPNVVIAISDNIVFSKEMLSQLNKLNLDREIILFGLPEWNEFRDLETSHLLGLHLHTFSSAVVNYNSNQVISWISRFRNTYHTEPGLNNYAFGGFDVGWYFLNALYNFGRNFETCLPYISVPLIQSRFEFEKTPFSGYQNTYWNLGYYNNYQFKKVHLHRE